MDGTMKNIVILTCGGTFDKVYHDALSDFTIGEPCVPDILHEGGMTTGWQLQEVMRKDSLDMTDEDRQTLRRAVSDYSCDRMVIIHGTDTMTDSAAALSGIPDKTIVLTGAMHPARFRQSDAVFNTGFAIAAAKVAPSGIYIAMNGQLHEAGQVRKNRSAGRFEAVDDS